MPLRKRSVHGRSMSTMEPENSRLWFETMSKKDRYLDTMAMMWIIYRTGIMDKILEGISEKEKLDKIKKILEEKEDKKE